jgi:acyl carrier protein
MTIRRIRKIIDEKLLAFGFDSLEAIAEMNSVTYLSLVVEIEETFGIRLPDEILASNAFKEVDIMSNIINNLLPAGKTSVFSWLGNVKIVKGKEFKSEEPVLTEDEKSRVIMWRNSGFLLIFYAIIILVYIAIIVLFNRYAADRIAAVLFSQYSPNSELTLNEKLILVAVFISVYILGFFTTVFIHEALHLIALPKDVKHDNVYIVLSGLSIKIQHFAWTKKCDTIIGLLCPAVVISAISVSGALLVNNPIAEYTFWICGLINIGNSLPDIVNAISVAVKMPKGSMMLNNYILLQKQSE